MPKLFENGLRQSGKLFCGETNEKLKFLLGNMDAAETIWLVVAAQLKGLHV